MLSQLCQSQCVCERQISQWQIQSLLQLVCSYLTPVLCYWVVHLPAVHRKLLLVQKGEQRLPEGGHRVYVSISYYRMYFKLRNHDVALEYTCSLQAANFMEMKTSAFGRCSLITSVFTLLRLISLSKNYFKLFTKLLIFLGMNKKKF